MHYSDLQLEKMIQQDDGDLLSSAAQLQHLESCAHCQNRLAQLSGDQWPNEDSLQLVRQALLNEEEVDGEDNYWQEDLAAGDTDRQSFVDSITVTIGPSGDWTEEAEQRETAAKVNTDFLEAALHPELMGRLGRYDVESLVGVGGFGIVFKAHDTELRRVVALKVLAPHLMSSVAARKRFAREAQTAAAIVHEHVTPIYDVVSNPKHCYLVMQYIAGHSLQDRVDSEGPLSVEDVLRIASQIAGGLDAAHQQGVVHRDVKPANILLEESVDRVLISDFGLARTADDANLTRSGVITGTPHYMSPEQASGALVDDRSDLFSLGSVMYFMCTGRPPFRAPQIVAVLNRICNHAHRPVAQIQPQIPGPVSDLIDRLLSKDPAKRFKSAASAKAAIGQLLADYQSGKLAADVREIEKYRLWKNWLQSAMKTSAIVAASALFCWVGAKLLQQGPEWFASTAGPLENRNSDSSSAEIASSNEFIGAQSLIPSNGEDGQLGKTTEFATDNLVRQRSRNIQTSSSSSSGESAWSILARQTARTRNEDQNRIRISTAEANQPGMLHNEFSSVASYAGSGNGAMVPFRPAESTLPGLTRLWIEDVDWRNDMLQLDSQLRQMEIQMQKFEVEFLILEQEPNSNPSEQ